MQTEFPPASRSAAAGTSSPSPRGVPVNDIARPQDLAAPVGIDAGPELGASWMPSTANRVFEAAPRLLACAEGMRYRTPEGHVTAAGQVQLELKTP